MLAAYSVLIIGVVKHKVAWSDKVTSLKVLGVVALLVAISVAPSGAQAYHLRAEREADRATIERFSVWVESPEGGGAEKPVTITGFTKVPDTWVINYENAGESHTVLYIDGAWLIVR
jgi:hypothetical protein